MDLCPEHFLTSKMCDVADLFRGQRHTALEVSRQLEIVVGPTEQAAVPGRPFKRRLQLVAVKLDCAVAHIQGLPEGTVR